jgi:hypothetical protein
MVFNNAVLSCGFQGQAGQLGIKPDVMMSRNLSSGLNLSTLDRANRMHMRRVLHFCTVERCDAHENLVQFVLEHYLPRLQMAGHTKPTGQNASRRMYTCASARMLLKSLKHARAYSTAHCSGRSLHIKGCRQCVSAKLRQDVTGSQAPGGTVEADAALPCARSSVSLDQTNLRPNNTDRHRQVNAPGREHAPKLERQAIAGLHGGCCPGIGRALQVLGHYVSCARVTSKSTA